MLQFSLTEASASDAAQILEQIREEQQTQRQEAEKERHRKIAIEVSNFEAQIQGYLDASLEKRRQLNKELKSLDQAWRLIENSQETGTNFDLLRKTWNSLPTLTNQFGQMPEIPERIQEFLKSE